MINLLFAEENIHKYKFDYNGYLVIVDRIRTMEVLNSYDLISMRQHLQDLETKYCKELNVIRSIEENKKSKKTNYYKLTQEQVVEELKYLLKRLPAIGFMILGRGKDIGIDIQVSSNPTLI